MLHKLLKATTRGRHLVASRFSTYNAPTSRYADIRGLKWMLHSVPLVHPFPDDDTGPILEAAHAFVSTHGHLDAKFDEHECQFEPSLATSSNSSSNSPSSSPVVQHPETKPLLDAYVDAGFTQMQDPDGLNLPYPLACAASAVTSSAFTSGVLGHWTLTQCAANLLKEHGSSDLVEKYHPKLMDGTWTGTMALSETQAGSSLVEIATTATPSGNPGEYRIKVRE